MKFIKSFHLVPVALAAALALPAHADVRRPLVDSTGVAKTVVATQQAGLTVNEVKNIAGDVAGTIINGGNTTNTVPAGYTEITTSMYSHYLGSGDSGLAAAGYYYGLNYPVAGASGSSPSTGVSLACNSDTTQRVVVIAHPVYDTGDGSTAGGEPTDYYVCEPQGTRSTLQKIVGATVVTISSSTLSNYVLAGTLGVNTGAATAICQAQGYTSFVQGSIAYTQWGSGCDDSERVTQYRNGSWVSDTICYNQLMSSMQCWK